MSISIKKPVGTHIRYIRRNFKLTQFELATLADLSENSIYRAEKDIPVSPRTLRKIVDCFTKLFNKEAETS